MKKRKPEELEPLPRTTFIVVGLMAVVLIGLVFAGSKYYLGNWRGDSVFLPVALFCERYVNRILRKMVVA